MFFMKHCVLLSLRPLRLCGEVFGFSGVLRKWRDGDWICAAISADGGEGESAGEAAGFGFVLCGQENRRNSDLGPACV